MRKLRNILLAAAIAGALSCSAGGGSLANNANAGPTPLPTPRAESPDSEIKRELAKFAAEAKGKVGVAALHLKTGEYFSLNGDQRFPMQSVYKLPIAMAVVKQFENQRMDLGQKVPVTKDDFVRKGMASVIRDKHPNGTEISVRDLIWYAIVESDGTASDVLLKVVGGAARVQTYLERYGITDMRVVNTEKEIGRDWETQYDNWSTPEASVSLLKILYDEGNFAPAYREMLLNDLRRARTGPGRIRGLLEDAEVAHKTGTSGTRNGITAATNDIGIVTLPNGQHFAIAVFVSDSPADLKVREATIAKVTKVMWNYWKR
jgi:beta-lactamase class A